MAAFPQATLGIAGTGELEAGLRAQISALGLSESVTLLGRVSEDELVRRYQQADLVVLPTQELEGFRPHHGRGAGVRNSRARDPAGATPELLAAIDASLVSTGTSSTQIADAALELLRDRDRLERLARLSRARVDPAMGWDAVVQRHLEIYTSLDDR